MYIDSYTDLLPAPLTPPTPPGPAHEFPELETPLDRLGEGPPQAPALMWVLESCSSGICLRSHHQLHYHAVRLISKLQLHHNIMMVNEYRLF